MIYRPGDIFLQHGTGKTDLAVRIGEGWRFSKEDAYWNHCGVIIDEQGNTLEAELGGIRSYPLLPRPGTVTIIPIEPAEARAKIVEFAKSRAGREYGILECASLFVTLATGFNLLFLIRGHYICSGFVGACMTFASIDVGDMPEGLCPAFFAQRYGPLKPLTL